MRQNLTNAVTNAAALAFVLIVFGGVLAELHAQTSKPKAAPAETSAAATKPAAAKPAGGPLVNLNTASLVDLETLPGIGAKTAARIVDYRQKKGSFKKVEELMNVQGIGEKSFLKLKPRITVGGNAQ